MNHDQARKLLDEYADGSLAPETIDEVKKHIEQCRECSEMVSQIQALVSKIGMLPEKISPPHDLWKDVFHQIHDLKVVQIKKEEVENPVEEIIDEEEEKSKEEARKEIAKKKEQKEKEEKKREKKREKESKGIRLYNLEDVFKKNRTLIGIAGAFIVIIIAVILVTATGDVTWQVSGVQGEYKINGQSLAGGELNADDVLETSGNPAVVMIPGLGQVSLDAWSRIEKKEGNVFLLTKGGFTAENKNAAESFRSQVFGSEIKAAGRDAVFKVQMNNDKTADLTVSNGKAIAAFNKFESVVIPGLVCKIRENGPEIPMSLNCSGSTRKSLELLSYYNDQDALNEILNEAGMNDGVSVWHLLKRITGDNRGAVFNKLYSLYPPPKGVDQESILRLKEEALTKWFDQIVASM